MASESGRPVFSLSIYLHESRHAKTSPRLTQGIRTKMLHIIESEVKLGYRRKSESLGKDKIVINEKVSLYVR